jgi:hypothetical protein
MLDIVDGLSSPTLGVLRAVMLAEIWVSVVVNQSRKRFEGAESTTGMPPFRCPRCGISDVRSSNRMGPFDVLIESLFRQQTLSVQKLPEKAPRPFIVHKRQWLVASLLCRNQNERQWDLVENSVQPTCRCLHQPRDKDLGFVSSRFSWNQPLVAGPALGVSPHHPRS